VFLPQDQDPSDATSLEYQGPKLEFGPANEDWGVVDQMRVEVQIPPGDGQYYTLGATTIDVSGVGVTVSEGETLEIPVASERPRLNYTSGTNSLSTFPTDVEAFWRLFINQVQNDNSNLSWKFEIVKNDGTIAETVRTIDKTDVWSLVSNGVEYQGPDVEWGVVQNSYTIGAVRVIVEDRDFENFELTTVSTSGPSPSAGQTPVLQSGDLSLTLA
jgi:hypothetical protein